MAKKTKWKKCLICCTDFPIIEHGNQKKYCSEECAKEAQRRRQRGAYQKRYKEDFSAIRRNNKALADIADEASKNGLSYGEYVAKMEGKPWREKDS